MSMEHEEHDAVRGASANEQGRQDRSSEDALVERARLRRAGEKRGETAPASPDALLELAQDQRPFSRYLAGRDAREASMRAYVIKARRARALLIAAGFDARYATVPVEVFPWHCLSPEVATAYTDLLRRSYSNAKSRENLVGVVRRLIRHSAAAGLMSVAHRERLLACLPVPGSPTRGAGREISLADIRRLLNTKSAASARLDARDTALIAVFLSTGLRVSEVSEIDMGDLTISPDGGASFSVRSKGGRRRGVWLAPSATELLAAWLKVRGDHPGAVFDSTARPGKALTPYGVSQLLERRARAAGISERFTSHDMRRTFATRALRDGVDPFTLQRLLGHVNVQTTLIYDRRTELEDREVLLRLDVTFLERRRRTGGEQ